MDEEIYRISMSDGVYEVYIGFFSKMKVARQDIVGDTWFFSIENGDGTLLSFSIYDGYWQRAKAHLREIKIDSVLE